MVDVIEGWFDQSIFIRSLEKWQNENNQQPFSDQKYVCLFSCQWQKKQEPTFAYVFLFVICGIYEDCLSFHIILQLQSFYYSVSNSAWEYEYLFEEWIIKFSLPLECLKNMCILFPCNMIRYVENKGVNLKDYLLSFFHCGMLFWNLIFFSLHSLYCK